MTCRTILAAFLLTAGSALPAAKPRSNQANMDDMWVTAPVPELPAELKTVIVNLGT